MEYKIEEYKLFKKIGLDKINKELTEKEEREVYNNLSYYDKLFKTNGLLTSLFYNNLNLKELLEVIEELKDENERKLK